jgi:3-oxoacyl-[acyl-carrier protein] reductase
MDIKGKAAVITGASRGVGAATALALAKGGCSVLINYGNSKDAAEKVKAEAESAGVQAILYQGDVADDSVCRGMMQAAMNAFGRLDILVNNAGTTDFIPHSDLEAVTEEVWSRIMNVNLKGPFQCARAAKPFLDASGNGEIVTVSSAAAYNGAGSCIPYSCSKAAVVNMTISLARVFGPHTRVNSIAPGIIKGDWLRKGLGDKYDKNIAQKESVTPLNNVCAPKDVADAILSIITGSDLVTGQTLLIDGGFEVGKQTLH